MITDYDGATVIDGNDNDIGTVERTYLDADGSPQFIEVSLGRIFHSHRLVPAEGTEVTDGGLRVPYTKQVIEDSPDASSAGAELGGDLLAAARAYYDQWQEEDAVGTETTPGESVAIPGTMLDDAASAPDTTAGQGESAAIPGTMRDDSSSTPDAAVGQVRDLGDVIEVPIVEEEVVKRPVVKEVVRIRKTPVVTRETVREDVRREEVEVEQEGTVAGDDPGGNT